MAWSRVRMSRRRARPAGGTTGVCVALAVWSLLAPRSPADDRLAHFESAVRPLLALRCLACHGAGEAHGGLRLDSLEAILRGGDSGPAIVPGDPAGSLLVSAVRQEGLVMPPEGGRLADAEIAALETWVRDGAAWTGSPPAAEWIATGLPAPAADGPRIRPRPARITDADREWWAWRPLEPHAPPATDRHPVDAFVDTRLAEEGLEPLPAADRATLARRLFFTALGLPPTPEETEAFVADDAPDAVERLVDRLLADPRHAERMARHWLDLARYADSDGFRQDAFRPHAWHYRDWVVEAFRTDMPYDRFVVAQLAGDEIPEDPRAFVATGFLRQTPYEYNQIDVPRQWDDILDDATETTADVFLALGLGCARCHDHKYDPLLRSDHARLRAVFAPLDWRDGVAPPPPDAPVPTEGQRAWIGTVTRLRGELARMREEAGIESAWAGLERFPPEMKALVMKPAAARSAREEQWVRLASRQLSFKPEKLPDDLRGRYEAVAAELAAFEQAHAADRPPAPAPVPAVGEVRGADGSLPEGPEPGLPEVLGGAALAAEEVALPGGTRSSGRRRALGEWIVGPGRPLAARVVVNRLWQWHFGTGLAAEPSDFGLLGAPPDHPRLLDWLAMRLIDGGWSLRRIERLLLTSDAFARASRIPDTPAARHAATVDPRARLLWRRDCRRLDAEQVRDAALAASAELDMTAGGPSVKGDRPRRSVYLSVIRNARDPLLDAFDFPDSVGSCPRRNVTTTPTQALLMLNGTWLLDRARAVAARVESLGVTGDRERAAAAWRLVMGGEPAPERLEALAAFLGRQRSLLAAEEGTPPAEPAVADPHGRGALEDLCHVLLNSSDFLYVE